MPLFTPKKPTDNPFIQLGKFSSEELPIAQLIQQRRLQMLVHSYLYYELDQSIIPDSTWSQWAVELSELQTKHPQIAAKVCYSKAFANWDGSTGAFLPLQDPWVIKKTNYLLNIHRGENAHYEYTKVLKSTRIPSSQSTKRKKTSEQRSNKLPERRRSLF